MTGDQGHALAAAQEAAARNPIGSYVVPITAMDLEFGASTRDDPAAPYQFTPSDLNVGNSVRLTTRTLASSADGGIAPVFPVFGASMMIHPQRTAVSTQGVIDIALVVDRSGSMAYSTTEIAQYPPSPLAAPAGWDFGDPVPPNSRWLDLIAAVQTFHTELNDSPQEELLSLSVYNNESSTLQKLTLDYPLVLSELDAISIQFDSGGTSIGQGMYEGLAAVTDPVLSRSHASKVIVLMTDGVHNYGTTPASASYSVADAGVTLFTITFSDEADQTAMQEIAERCGGQHFHAVTALQLQEAFRKIARSLPTLLTQ